MSSENSRPGFVVQPIPQSGLIGRLLGRVPREAAFVEIRNILATTPYEQVRESDIGTVLAKCKLLPRDATPELCRIFEDAVVVLTSDRELDEADRRGLTCLQQAFELTTDEVREATEQAVGAVFERTMLETLVDGTFTPEERTMLDRMSTALGMSEAQSNRLYTQAAIAAVQSAFHVAVADKRYNATEEQVVQALAASLGVKLNIDIETAAIVERYKLLGQIEDGQLPTVDVPILLQRGEVCHFAAQAIDHKEIRTVTKRVNYGGPTASVRIMKGVRWRIGSIAVQRVTQDVLTTIDSVDVYFTNKKLFLQGARKNTSIPLAKIMQFTVFSDGLQIEKQSGRAIVLVGSADWELAGACLDAAGRASRQ